MAKSDAKKRANMMVKEWWKSKSTTQSINELIAMGVLHNQELGGWTPERESFPDPRPSKIIVLKIYSKEILESLFILFCKVCFFIMRLEYPTCIPLFSLFLPLFIFVRLLR